MGGRQGLCAASSAWHAHTVVIHFFIGSLLTISHLSSENLLLPLVVDGCLKDLRMSVIILFFRESEAGVGGQDCGREPKKGVSWSSETVLCVV